MIGYYAHHHGSGHVTRATSIAHALDEPCTVLSSRPRPAGSTLDWVNLPLDVFSGHSDATYVDPSAGGLVHWAPMGVRGLTDRMATIAAWIAAERPKAVVVDVSVEVAVFVRMLGVPVVVMAMPGERTDEPHRLAYRAATRILAPWSRDVYDPAWLHTWSHKTDYVGVISRFAGRPRESMTDDRLVVVLGGAGGTSLTQRDIDDAAHAVPEYRWAAAGVDSDSWVDDVWPLLCSASVVVTHAGQNAIADIAAAGAAAVVVPQDRPYGEQHATARSLAQAGVAVMSETWPTPEHWRPLLDRALDLDPKNRTRLGAAGSAARAASILANIGTGS